MKAAKGAERQARDARRAALTEQIERLHQDIHALNVAASDIGKYVGRFPSDTTNEIAYFSVCQFARQTANDVINQAALAAPEGYGARINTLMTALHRLGDRTKEITSDQHSSAKGVGGEIYNRIDELRTVESQIHLLIPRYQGRPKTRRDELDTLAEKVG